MPRLCRALLAAALVAVCLLVAPAGVSSPSKPFVRLASINGGTTPQAGVARAPDGVLHLVYPNYGSTGLTARAISPGGSVLPAVQALQGWQAGLPGLVSLPNGTLEAVFGAIAPAPKPTSSLWAITSTNGGASWSAPADVKGGGPLEALVYGADVTAQVTGSTPVLTLPQAGGLLVQQGLGPGSPAVLVTNSSDGSVGGVNSAVDGMGTVAASWQSLAGHCGDFIQAIAPTVGAPQHVPGQFRNHLVIAGRDKGAGIFAAYTTDGNHVRLIRYGGGSVAVGEVPGLTASTLGVATGPSGRIWVMWGSDSGIAVTRSNKANTRFEPIQHLAHQAATLYRVAGDGRLGPLDLLANEIPASGTSTPGLDYARVLPELTVKIGVQSIKNGKGDVIAHKLTVTVTDAGDAVAGATVAAASAKKKTSSNGTATLTIPGSASVSLPVTVTDPGYQPVTKTVQL
jgi:hypothetical protein